MTKLPSKINKLTIFLTIFVAATALNACVSNFLSFELATGKEFESALLNLIFVKNTGAAFSLFANHSLFLVLLGILAVVLVVGYIVKNLENLSPTLLCFGAILTAGICGNLFERIYFGYVRDFFELAFVAFPVFNISDVYINLGVFAIILVLFGKRYENDGRN